MTLRFETVSSSARPFGTKACPQCGRLAVAPDASEFVSNGQIRHMWSCDSCGEDFETTVEMKTGPIW